MKPTFHHRWLAGLALLAVMATACTSPESDARSVDTSHAETVTTEPAGPAPTIAVTVPATVTDDDSETEHLDVGDEIIDVTIDEIGVSTVLPSSWTPAPGGGFTDGSSQLSAFALLTADAGDDDLDGFEPIGDVTAAGRVWELHTQQTDEQIVGLAFTEIGDRIYGFVLMAPVVDAETQLDTVVIPALEAFHVTEVPIVSGPFRSLETASIDIDGRAVAYLSAGTGTPTVVFEAGLGSGMASWALVAPDVAQHARVFAYDRPGYGGSDLTDSPRDGATMVEELRALLAATGHEPPFLLVGHSLGGTLMDLFARTHPEEVAGLVLVDSRHHEFTERCAAEFGPVECDVPTDDEIAGVPEHIIGEWRALPDTEAQSAAAPPLSDMPLAVIVAGIALGSPQTFELWGQTQQEYADQVPGSQLIVAEDSDHGIPGRQPQLIVDAIIDLIGSIR